MNVWIAGLALLGPASLVGTLVNAYLQRRKMQAEESKVQAEGSKTRADAAAVLTETATELLAPLREELQETRTELRTTRREISALRDHLDLVEGLLRRNGIPVPEFTWPRSNGHTT